ncbi:hypothetical protein BDZ45DRAFT_502834 [Acephala macrosclerotiorum]|nr:hypothetical protein BDZ45DRAFT_502834 [Acephala macrosclerotiorum]
MMDSRHLNLAGDARSIDRGNTFLFISEFDGLLPFPEELSQELDRLSAFHEELTHADLSSTYSPFPEQQDHCCSHPLVEAPHLEEFHAHAYDEALQLPFLYDYDVSFPSDSSHIFDIDFEMMRIDSIMDSFFPTSQSLLSGAEMPLNFNEQPFASDNLSSAMSVSSSTTLTPTPHTQAEPISSHEIAASQPPPPASDSGSPNSSSTPASSSNFSGSSAYLRTPPSIPCSFPGCNRLFSLQHELNRHLKSHTRPSQCPHCGRGFETSKDVKRHVNDVHETTKRFFCSVSDCRFSRTAGEGSGFKRKENWKRHVRSKHADLGGMG